MKNLVSIIKFIFGKSQKEAVKVKTTQEPINFDNINFTRSDLFLRRSILDSEAWQSHYDCHSCSPEGYQVVYDLVIYAGEDAYPFEIERGIYQVNEAYAEGGEKGIEIEQNINNYPDIDFSKKPLLQSVGSFIDGLLRDMFCDYGVINISDDEVKALCIEVMNSRYKWDSDRVYRTKAEDALQRLVGGTVLHRMRDELQQAAKAYYFKAYDQRMKAEFEKRKPILNLVKRQKLLADARQRLIEKGLICG